jgi:hypothetical protein
VFCGKILKAHVTFGDDPFVLSKSVLPKGVVPRLMGTPGCSLVCGLEMSGIASVSLKRLRVE